MNAGSMADGRCRMQWQRTNDNDTDGADKRHQKWGIGLCALGVIYYFTVYSDLVEQVTLT